MDRPAAGDGGGGALDGGVERAADIIVNEGGGSAGSLCVLMLVRKQDLVSPGCQDHLAGEVEACKVLGRSGVDPLVGLGLACKEVGGIAQEDHFIGGAFPGLVQALPLPLHALGVFSTAGSKASPEAEMKRLSSNSDTKPTLSTLATDRAFS